jgi:protein TonB
MEAKKTIRADLSLKQNLFLSIGFIISLSLVITAVEWKSYERSEFALLNAQLESEVEDILEIPPTTQPPPPPPKVRMPVIVEVPDIEEIEEDIEVDLDVEITEETEIEEVVFVDAPELVEEEVDEVFTFVEQQPAPDGGLEKFYSDIAKKVRYPNQARRMGIQGKVFVRFIIDKQGNITNIEVVKGIGGGCDEEAIRVMKTMPAWSPGKQRGVPVRAMMIIPINFQLKNDNS